MANDYKVKKINSLQGLRAILFFMIFIFHTSMIGNITKTTIYQKIGGGGGTEAVAFSYLQYQLC